MTMLGQVPRVAWGHTGENGRQNGTHDAAGQTVPAAADDAAQQHGNMHGGQNAAQANGMEGSGKDTAEGDAHGTQADFFHRGK